MKVKGGWGASDRFLLGSELVESTLKYGLFAENGYVSAERHTQGDWCSYHLLPKGVPGKSTGSYGLFGPQGDMGCLPRVGHGC